MKLPEIKKNEDGTSSISFDLGLDLNKDGQKSVKAVLSLVGDEKELAEELLGEVMKKVNIPDVVKKLLGIA